MKKAVAALWKPILSMAIGIILGVVGCYLFFLRYSMEADLANAVETQSLISQLDRGKIDDVSELLNLKLDTDILNIYSSLKHMSESNRMAATNLFYDVIKMRAKYPSNDSQTPTIVRDKVSSILESAVKSNSINPAKQ